MFKYKLLYCLLIVLPSSTSNQLINHTHNIYYKCDNYSVRMKDNFKPDSNMGPIG